MILIALLCFALTGCGNLGNTLTRTNKCHAKCMHEYHTHDFVQVGEFCSCKPEVKK